MAQHTPLASATGGADSTLAAGRVYAGRLGRSEIDLLVPPTCRAVPPRRTSTGDRTRPAKGAALAGVQAKQESRPHQASGLLAPPTNPIADGPCPWRVNNRLAR